MPFSYFQELSGEKKDEVLEFVSGLIMTGAVELIRSEDKILESLPQPVGILNDSHCYKSKIRYTPSDEPEKELIEERGIFVALGICEIAEGLDYNHLRTPSGNPRIPVSIINMEKTGPQLSYAIDDGFERLRQLSNLIFDVKEKKLSVKDLEPGLANQDYDLLSYLNPSSIRADIYGDGLSDTELTRDLEKLVGGKPFIVIYSKYLYGAGTKDEGIAYAPKVFGFNYVLDEQFECK